MSIVLMLQSLLLQLRSLIVELGSLLLTDSSAAKSFIIDRKVLRYFMKLLGHFTTLLITIAELGSISDFQE